MMLLVAAIVASTPPPRVAIVGGGIAGGATSYYLQQFLAQKGLPNASIAVFERNDYVGGRLHEVTFGSQQLLIEVGGAAWTNNNHYMIELAAAMHMNTSLTAPNADTANLVVWNGSALTGGIPLVLRNLRSLVKTLGIEAEFLHTLEANYAQQAATTFRNLSTMLGWGDISRYTASSIASYLAAAGVSPELISLGAVPLTRAIYNRDGGANSFSMLASLTAELSHHKVLEGNSRLVQALFDDAAASLRLALNTSVARIALRGDDEFEVLDADGASLGRFDHVVIAAPIERTGIAFDNMTLPDGATRDRGFTDWHVTLVEASDLDMAQFSAPAAPLAAPKWACNGNCIVLTSATGSTTRTPYVCVQPLGKHAAAGASGTFMVYSDAALDAATLAKLFVGVKDSMTWYHPYTFAGLEPDDGAAAQPVVLHEAGLINANAVESISSAMEISAIGARNAAALIAELAAARAA